MKPLTKRGFRLLREGGPKGAKKLDRQPEKDVGQQKSQHLLAALRRMKKLAHRQERRAVNQELAQYRGSSIN